MEEPNIELVYQAVATLYNNSNNKENASEWLEMVQHSAHACKIADQLLRNNRNSESCYFAAQTIRTKIQYYFHEFPADQHVLLRNTLLEHIAHFDERTSHDVKTQLCLAMAHFILRTETWENACLELIDCLSQGSAWPLMQILTVLPEEVDRQPLKLSANRRKEILNDFQHSAPGVSGFLSQWCLDYPQETSETKFKILKCFTAWVSVCASVIKHLCENQVVINAISILSSLEDISESLHDAATELIITLINHLDESEDEDNMEVFLFRCALAFEPNFRRMLSNENICFTVNYCRIFTELADKLLEQIVSCSTREGMHYATRVLDLVLLCGEHPYYEVVWITLSIWRNLSEELYNKNDEFADLYQPYVARLITLLHSHCRIQGDRKNLLADLDEFKDFRLSVAGCIRKTVYIMGSNLCFLQMFANLQAPGLSWAEVESSMFVMQAVAKYIVPSQLEVVPTLLKGILSLPVSTNINLTHTAVTLIGQLGEWIYLHPETLFAILNFLANFLPQAELDAAAATALQNICAVCKYHMPQHVPFLLETLRQIDRFAISDSAINGLLKGVATIVNCMPNSMMEDACRELCAMQIIPLRKLLQQNVDGVTMILAERHTDPCVWLNRLSSIFKNMQIENDQNQVNLCKPYVLEIWIILSQTLEKHQSNERIMEHCCRTTRFLVHCINHQMLALLGNVVAQIVGIFAKFKHPCILNLGSILIAEYGRLVECPESLLQMVQSIVPIVFQLLQEVDGFRKHAEIIDAFFRLYRQFIIYRPILALHYNALESILNCAFIAASLEHKEANNSVMRFWCTFINHGMIGWNQPDFHIRRKIVATYLDIFGQQLIMDLLHSCIYKLHVYMLNDVAEVLLKFVEFNKQVTARYLAVGLESLPKVKNGMMVISSEELNDFHILILNATNAKSVKYVLQDLIKLAF